MRELCLEALIDESHEVKDGGIGGDPLPRGDNGFELIALPVNYFIKR